MAGKKKDEPKTDKPAKRKEVMQSIDVKLNDSELIERGKLHATALNEIDLMKPRHDAEKKRMKLEQSNAEAKERGLRTVIETGREPRDVKCWLDFEWTKGRVTIRRLDTEEEVTSREIFDSERQVHLGTMRAEMERKGVMAVGVDGKPIVGTPAQQDFVSWVGAEVEKIKANANSKDLDPGEGVAAPPDALDDDENDAA